MNFQIGDGLAFSARSPAPVLLHECVSRSEGMQNLQHVKRLIESEVPARFEQLSNRRCCADHAEQDGPVLHSHCARHACQLQRVQYVEVNHQRGMMALRKNFHRFGNRKGDAIFNPQFRKRRNQHLHIASTA